jgi:hypothetical protein
MNQLETLLELVQLGFTIGVVVFVIVAAARIGWALAPFVLGAALLAWLFL